MEQYFSCPSPTGIGRLVCFSSDSFIDTIFDQEECKLSHQRILKTILCVHQANNNNCGRPKAPPLPLLSSYAPIIPISISLTGSVRKEHFLL